MVKALFYVEGEKAPVQHEGCRMIITTQLINEGITKVGAFNLPDGRVEVVFEGDEEKLIAIHKEIKDNLYAWMKAKAADAEALRKRIGNPGVIVSDLEFNDNLLVLDIGLFSHSLTFDQIYKGVSVYKELAVALTGLNETIKTFKEKP